MAEPKDAETFDPDDHPGRRPRVPSDEERQAAATAMGGMALLVGVIAEIGDHVAIATQKDGEDADIEGAVLDALECRGDAADSLRAGLYGLCCLASDPGEDDDEDDDDVELSAAQLAAARRILAAEKNGKRRPKMQPAPKKGKKK